MIFSNKYNITEFQMYRPMNRKTTLFKKLFKLLSNFVKRVFSQRLSNANVCLSVTIYSQENKVKYDIDV